MTNDYDIVYLSLGAGVQSSALYLMAINGLIDPMPSVAIFADTQCEPDWVLRHVEYLRGIGGDKIPIDVVTAGSLEKDVLAGLDGVRFASVPFRVAGTDGRPSLLRRHCTRDYKIDPVKKQVRTRLGLKHRQRAKGKYRALEYIGISTDEAQRMKPSRYPWISSRWPLIEQGMTRDDCKSWVMDRGYRVPSKSACVFCPFRDDRTWADWKQNHPKTFARAVDFDKKIRAGKLRGVKEYAYIHRSLKPLDEVDFGDDTSDQLEIDFGNECEGMCGV